VKLWVNQSRTSAANPNLTTQSVRPLIYSLAVFTLWRYRCCTRICFLGR